MHSADEHQSYINVMESNSGYVTNLVNSIIGVSVLAMPYCFKQCGIILGLGLLAGAAYLTSLSCHMLSTSAFHKKRRTYEYLALYTLGPTGKFAVELSMIGLMLGTCVAFYVVIGDLATEILDKFIVDMEPPQIRTFVLVFCGLCVALPLGLMKDLSILGYLGMFSLMFYIAFVSVVILNAVTSGLLQWVWWNDIVLWKPGGIFKVLPIFSLAYSCHCQLFVVYDSLENPSVRRIDSIVSSSLKFVCSIYMLVGFFGYTTFQGSVQGNLLKNFKTNLLLDVIKLGFALSVVVGFPLMIFPCRQSIYTLFFSKVSVGDGMPVKTYIAPFAFKSITLCIVMTTMVTAIMIPNVETVLGLTGATMGSLICFIFPALIFEKAAPKGPSSLPKLILGIGIALFVISTYTNLQPNNVTEVADIQNIIPKDDLLPKSVKPPLVPDDQPDVNINEAPDVEKQPADGESKPKAEVIDNEKRLEPANPVDPVIEDALQDEKDKEDDDDDDEGKDAEEQKMPERREAPHVPEPEEIPNNKPDVPELDEAAEKVDENQKDGVKQIVDEKNKIEDVASKDYGEDDEIEKVEEKSHEGGQQPNENDDKEGVDEKILLEKIKVQHEKQQELLQKQEELIKALEIHQDQHEREDNLKNENVDEQNKEKSNENLEAKQPISDHGKSVDKNPSNNIGIEAVKNEQNNPIKVVKNPNNEVAKESNDKEINPANPVLSQPGVVAHDQPAVDAAPIIKADLRDSANPAAQPVKPAGQPEKIHSENMAHKPAVIGDVAPNNPMDTQHLPEPGVKPVLNFKADDSLRHPRQIRSTRNANDCPDGKDCNVKPKTIDLK